MTLQEMLATQEARNYYKELVKKYHPDKGGDVEKMKRINAAKDVGDEALRKIYRELNQKEKSKVYDDTNDDYFKKISEWIKFYSNYNSFIIIPKKDGEGNINLIIYAKDSSGNILKHRTTNWMAIPKFNNKNEFIQALSRHITKI